MWNLIIWIAWNIVFKLPKDAKPSGFSSIIAFWNAAGHLNGDDVSAMTDFSASSKIYKSKLLDDWATRSFSAVSEKKVVAKCQGPIAVSGKLF